MRIALVSRELHPFGGGIGVQVAGAAAALSSVAEVTVLTSSAHEHQWRALQRSAPADPLRDVRVAFVEEPTPGDIGSYYSFLHLYSARVYETLRSLYPDGGPDLIEFADFLGEGLVTVQARRGYERLLRGTGVCVRLHTSAEMCSVLNGHIDDEFETRMVFAGERHALQYADHLLSPGGDVDETYRRFYVSDPLAPAVRIRPMLIRRRLSASQSPPPIGNGLRFLYVGRLERRKGVHDLVRALTSLRREDWMLTLVGSDTDSAPLGMSMREHLELSAGGDRRLRFIESIPREELARVVADHHAIVCPSRWECWPSVVLEALEGNRPVVATPTGGMVEMLAEPGAGWLSEDNGDVAMAGLLERLLDDPNPLLERIEARAPEQAHARLMDEDRFRSSYLQLAAASKGAPSTNGRPRITGHRPAEPLVSVVVPYFALDRYVEDTLRSVFAQEHRNLEVLVVNDGSFRPEDAILKELATRYPIRVLTQENSGLGRARNTGIALSRGRYVLPLDADNMIEPSFVKRCVEILEGERSVAFVTTWSRYIDDEGREYVGLGAGYQPIGNSLPTVSENNVAGDATAVIRRRIFDLGHWYSTELTSYEDWQFYRELHAAGQIGRVIPERLLLYRVRAGSMIREVGVPRHARLYGEMLARLRERQTQWVCRNDSVWRRSAPTR
jgi:glycogen(starch) synthase